MVILVEASGGNYNDEISATRTPLLGPLRAAAVAPGAPLQVSLSPFSEAAVREIDSASPKDWSAARVTGINTTFAGDTNFLQLKPVELSGDSVLESASADDVTSAIFVGGFSGLLHRLGPSTPALFDQGLDAMRTMLADSYDDRYSPQWLLGTVDFINVTGLSASSKTRLKGLLVLQTDFASEAEITAALPTGVATGSASAAMPDDAFELVPDIGIVRESPVGTIFNKRGALMAYQLASSTNTYRYLYSGSVGELYGDGDIGIGRWHGGVVFDATDGRALDTLVNPQILSASDGRVYALGRPATGLPSCGIRVAPVVASTLPIQTAGTGFKPVVGLAPDSRLAVQYFGATANVGFDIGLQMADGSVYRAKTTGALTAPWASQISAGTNGAFSAGFRPEDPAPSQLPDLRIDVNGLLAGAGGRRLVLKVQIYSSAADAMTLAAAFTAPDTPPDTGGCATPAPGDGSAISPPPVDGTYSVFAGVDSSLFMGVPFLTTFRPSGAILTAGLFADQPQLSIPAQTPIFELAGNTDAVIGRAMGPFTLRGVSYDRSLPFGAARAPGIFPATGSRRYTLVSSSAVIAAINAGGGAVTELTGQVTSATLDIDFVNDLFGTPSPFYGNALYSIQGTVGGTNFTFSNSSGGLSPLTYYRDSAVFSGGGGVEGALSGPNAQYAVVRFLSVIGGVPVQGVLLLQSP